MAILLVVPAGSPANTHVPIRTRCHAKAARKAKRAKCVRRKPVVKPGPVASPTPSPDDLAAFGAYMAWVAAMQAAPVATATPHATPGTTATPGPAATPTSTTTPTPAPLFRTDYTAGLTSWQALQQPAGTNRIVTTAVPGDAADLNRPAASRVMQVTLLPGDMTTTGTYTAPRAEAYARHAVPGSTAPERWPDPVGSERWYSLSIFVPADFAPATDTKWLDLTQWKGYQGGSPPLAIEIQKSHFSLGGTRGTGLPQGGDLGAVVPGRWATFVVGVRWSTDATGWVEARRDGKPVIPRTSVSTMDVVDGHPDPIYLKQGLYRSAAWTVAQTFAFGPTTITVADPRY